MFRKISTSLIVFLILISSFAFAKNYEEEILDEILFEDYESDFEPFKLKVQQNSYFVPYSYSYKKEDTKTIIPVSERFSFIQDISTTRNKYNSQDYKILAGGEYAFSKYIKLASGLETNYRDLDQNPTSKKLYLIPSLHFGDRVSLRFYNKLNVYTYTHDHDIGLNISPFKSKAMDFGVYAGTTRRHSGAHSESIKFSTSFYFF